jgi:hypothetical protein
MAVAGLATAGPHPPMSPPGIGLAVYIACVVALLVAGFDDLVDLVAPAEKLTH